MSTKRLVEALTAMRSDSTSVGESNPDTTLLEEPGFETFVELVDSASDERYQLHHGRDALVEQLLETYRFMQVRPHDQALVRVAQLIPRDDPTQRNTLIEVVVPEQPFIVDTITLFLDFAGLQVVSSFFVSLPMDRNDSGQLNSIGVVDVEEPREILARFEVLGALDSDFQQSVEQAIHARLDVARRVVQDFKPMKQVLRDLASRYDRYAAHSDEEGHRSVVEDVGKLLRWVVRDNFILMGLAYYPDAKGRTFEPALDRSLGKLSSSSEEPDLVSEAVESMNSRGDRLAHWCIGYRSQEESPIHRSGKIDNLIFREIDEHGQPAGLFQIRGLFTFKAIQTLGSQIPFVRLKCEKLIAEAGFIEGSIEWKAHTNAFNSIPIEFLFESTHDEIASIIETILYVERARELRSHVVIDKRHRKGLYFLVLPRQGYSEDLRAKIESIIIESLGATYSDSRVYFGKFDTVLLTFFFTATERLRTYSRDELDERVRSVAGSWDERFLRALGDAFGLERALTLRGHYRQAFPEQYQLTTAPSEATTDVGCLERLRTGGAEIAFALAYNDTDRQQHTARLRVYLRENVFLSSLLPILDNFGIRVVDQAAYRVRLQRGETLHLHTFRLAEIDSDEHPILQRKNELIEALEMVFAHRVDNDVMNRLIIDVGLGWRDVLVIRAYVNYLRQLGVVNTFVSMSDAFREHPRITRLLIDFYAERFDPDLDHTLNERSVRCSELAEEVYSELQKVPSQAQDALFRLILNLFESTLRTTRFQIAEADLDERLSFKVDAEKLAVGSEPRPWREIFVHHYDVEGVHIRGGRLARGGLRWSDRTGDYREEILGLMRTQMVKNVLIVPVGAKGGFIVRRPHGDRDTRRAQADAFYEIYINALLDLTDNVVDGEIVKPIDVVSWDDDDPYLVVAADKGTAHLSDTANKISQARGFWLDDAFASGGSNGYDHKALGITARGAWESVKRHFREIGVDPEVDTVRVVGIGDMSGDVFGNGLLLSKTVQLLGAFNHMHIFIDPDPDPARSYAERKRLFELRRSTWKDYDPGLISDGGGVFDRNAKTIEIPERARRMLGLSSPTQRPDDVIRALLTLKVDLLWNGGIGTYIRASFEDNRDVGDLSNESVRVEAREIRCQVIGEGGNLGVTPLGRVELSMQGVHLNTDFVDNSAGVNCSDQEVNLKILLEGATRTSEIDTERRNELLQLVSDEVCDKVLKMSYEQTLMISLDAVRSQRDPFSFERTIKVLADRGTIVRERDGLPDLEQIHARARKGGGLARPELALLGAYAKMDLYRRLLEEQEAPLRDLDVFVTAYFPDSIVRHFSHHFGGHLLFREIAMTVLTNTILDHAGATFIFDVERETGVDPSTIVRAYLLLDEIYQSWGMKEVVMSLDGLVAAKRQYDALILLEEATRRSVSWVVSGRGSERLERLYDERGRYTEKMKEYEAQLPGSLPAVERERFREQEDVFYAAGFKIGLPDRLAKFPYLPAGLRIVDISLATGAAVEDVSGLYFLIGQHSHIFPLVRLCDQKEYRGRWESLAVRSIRNSLLDSLWRLTSVVVAELTPTSSGQDLIDRGLELALGQPKLADLRRDLEFLLGEQQSISALQVASARLERALA